MNLDTSWFDKKYMGDEKPSLDDKVQLFRQLDLKFSDRTKIQIEKEIREGLHRLGKKEGYSPGLDVVVHGLLFCLGGFVLDEQTYGSLKELYRKVIQKHKSERSQAFQSNYQG